MTNNESIEFLYDLAKKNSIEIEVIQISGKSNSVSFLEKLRSQEGRSNSVSNEYTRTHPLTKDRVSAAEQKYQKSKGEGLSDLSQYADAHERMKAKIFAYNYPDQTQFLYSGNRIVDHYARAMAAYRKNNLKNFLQIF